MEPKFETVELEGESCIGVLDFACDSLVEDHGWHYHPEFHGGRMTRIVDYVRDKLGEEIKQTDVAELVAMTPQGFSRFFRATTGRTFVSFVNVMRITQACKLLVNTRGDITDIAFECCYGNLSNFNRRFQELKHTTPRDYRAQHGRLEHSAIETTIL
jgi:transcriptional regulator GlxA family with amidase domain